MPVYVDQANIQYGRMKMSHLLADTPQELHEMAAKIRVKRKWYQKNASTPHYDICMEKRALALSYGAILVNRRELADILQRIRAEARSDW